MNTQTAIGGVCAILGIVGLHVIEFIRDGNITYVVVVVDSISVLAGIGLLTSTFFEKITVSFANRIADHLFEQYLLEKKNTK